MIILKLVSLFFLVWMTTVNVGRIAKSQSVPAINFVWMSASAVAFIYSMGWLS